MNFITKNLTMLIIQQEDSRLNITNIYSSPSESYNIIDSSSSIHQLSEVLSQSNEHVLIDDLNLHHKSWGEVQVSRKYRMTADLLKHMKLGKLILITSIEMITCELYSSKITVDLIFVS